MALQPRFDRPQEEVNLIYEDANKHHKMLCSGYDPKWFAKGTKLLMYWDKDSGTVLNAIANIPEEKYQELLTKAQINRAQ